MIRPAVRSFRSVALPGWSARASMVLAAISLVGSAPASSAAHLPSATAGCPTRGSTILDPAWSPDAKQIAWVLSCKGSTAQVWVAAADGSNAHVIARDVPFIYQLAWVRTRGLLYSVIDDQLWHLSAKGARSMVVGEFQPSAQQVPTDAAGDRVAWGVLRCACQGPIRVKSLSLGWTKTVGANPKFSDGNPTLSPDGRRVAYERRVCSPFGECRQLAGIWVSAIASGQSQRITGGGYFPEWSPDGRWIVYDDGNGRLVVVSPSGRRRAVFPAGGTAKTAAPNFAWSPDSRSIAVWLQRALLVFDVSTGRRIRVTPLSHGLVTGFVWSPDSKALLVPTESSCPSLLLVAANGSPPQLLRGC